MDSHCAGSGSCLPGRLGRALALALALDCGCSGGQSGNEGNPPEPPCFVPGGEEGLVVRVVEIRDGCISGEVQRFVTPIDAYSPTFRVGEQISSDYFTSAPVVIGDEVLVFYRAETETAVAVPIADNHVALPWGTATVVIALDELVADDCADHFPAVSSRAQASGSTTIVVRASDERPGCFQNPS